MNQYEDDNRRITFSKVVREHEKCLERITETVFMIQKRFNIKRSGVSDYIRKSN